MTILFWLCKYRMNKGGDVPISMRLTYEGKRVEIGTSQFINPKQWDTKKQKIKGDSEISKQLNSILNSFKAKALGAYDECLKTGQIIILEQIKAKVLGSDEQRKTLLQAFEYHNSQMKAKIGIEFAANTLKKYVTCLNKVTSFLTNCYKRTDIYLAELNYKFIADFDFYLKTTDKLKQNAVIKHMQQLKRIINVAILHGWLKDDPFSQYSCKLKEVERGFLTIEEVKSIHLMDLSNNKRLDEVRDVFLFCCYSGLAYADVKKLTSNLISKGPDHSDWIIINRTKTGTRSPIPLLPIAQSILNKYKGYGSESDTGMLLPVKSSQKMNTYLKEIAIKCGISKRVSMHLARHTFATSITLTHGVPIESVSKMLGHKNIRTTQIYAKVVDTKVSNDMLVLKGKLEELNKSEADG